MIDPDPEDEELDEAEGPDDDSDLEDDDFEDDDGQDDPGDDDDDDDDDEPDSRGDDDDDDDEPDPDDVEADLGEILKDRLASSDDEDEEDEDDLQTPSQAPPSPGGVKPREEDEWTCEGCFLIVNSRQFGRKANPVCPSGEDPCPSFDRL